MYGGSVLYITSVTLLQFVITYILMMSWYVTILLSIHVPLWELPCVQVTNYQIVVL